MKILIVDDSRAIQAIVRRALGKQGFTDADLRFAVDGETALAIALEWVPNLVLTDWHMPGMSGLELLQVMRQQLGADRSPQIGFVTTESVQSRLEEAERFGAAFILRKPFTDQQLGDAVRSAVAARPAALSAKPQATEGASSGGGSGPFSVQPTSEIAHHLSVQLHQPVMLADQAVIDLDTLVKPWTIAFYSLGARNEVRGFCVLDRPAAVLIGARLLGKKATDFSAAGALPDALIERLGGFLGDSSGTLFDASAGEKVNLLRSQQIPAAAPKLVEILEKKTGRRVFRVTTEGFLPGCLILIAR